MRRNEPTDWLDGDIAQFALKVKTVKRKTFALKNYLIVGRRRATVDTEGLEFR